MLSPVLIVSFNRPDKLKETLKLIRGMNSRKVFIFNDGPRRNNKKDKALIEKNLEIVSEFKDKENVEIFFRTTNFGLRKNVIESVSAVLETFESVIVLEDDVIASEAALEFCDLMLKRYENDSDIAFVSPYNSVPIQNLENKNKLARLSRYPESYAWAVWARSWKLYQDDISISIKKIGLRGIQKSTKSIISVIFWKLSFFEARFQLIDTWAYRWIATTWSENKIGIISNVNYIKYNGRDEGTHTNTRLKWDEIPICREFTWFDEELSIDNLAENYINKTIFNHNLRRLPIRLAITIYLILRKIKKTYEK